MGEEQHGQDFAGEQRVDRRKNPGRPYAPALRGALRPRAVRHDPFRKFCAYQCENKGIFRPYS